MSTLQFVGHELPEGSFCSDNSASSNAFGYQFGHFPENGLSFLDNNQDEEDSNDNPLYYNWADMDNYEDVDNMYRSSDSTPGFKTKNGDRLGWFSLSDTVGGSEDALNTPCSGSRSRKIIFENDDASRLDSMMHSGSEFELPESSAVYNRSSSPSNNYGYLQGGDTPYLCSVYGSSSDMTSLDQHMSAIQSENISLTSLSLHDYYTSEGVQSTRSDDSRDQMYSNKFLEASSNNNPTENECNDDVNMSISENVDGSGDQENSESFKSDDISVGATSFRQLQHVMNKLDPRAKLCIRDSLYRLAWSAEQRNYYESFQGGVTDDRDSMFAEGRYVNMEMEMETDTNPVDRSIAHLLFHRASDPSVMAGEDALVF